MLVPNARKESVLAMTLSARLLTMLGACGDRTFANPIRVGQLSLACGNDTPQDTLSGFDRCLLEQWQPCRLDRQEASSLDAEEVEVDSTVAFHYGPGGVLLRETLRSGGTSRVRSYRYDEAGNLLDVDERDTSERFIDFLERYSYRDGVRVESQRTPEEATTRYAFFGNRRIKGIDKAGPGRFEESYYWEGDRVTSVQRVFNTPFDLTLEYDREGRLIGSERLIFQPQDRSFEYDAAGRLVLERRLIFQSADIVYRWDTHDRLVNISRTALRASEQTFHYDCDA